MGDFNVASGQLVESAGVVSGISSGTVITAGGTANTKGSYAQLIASTSFHAKSILFHCGNADTNFVKLLIDIAVGAASSEQNIVENFYLDSTRINSGIQSIWMPLEIPKSSRIAVRTQSSTASQTCEIVIYLFGYSMIGGAEFQRATSYGADLSTSTGVQVDPGGTFHVKGAWSEIISSSTRDIRWMIISTGDHDASMVPDGWLLDIGVGGAGSEQVIVPDLYLRGETSPDILFPTFMSMPMQIPSGTRIAARAQSSENQADDRVFDIAILGFN